MTARGRVTLGVTFGPSSSSNYRRAITYARTWATVLSEVEPGRWRAAFDLEAEHPDLFGRAARLVAYTKNWRMTDVDIDGEPEVPYVVESMLWCASRYAGAYGRCTFRFFWDVYPKCMACPLFDRQRADGLIADHERDLGPRSTAPGISVRIAMPEELGGPPPIVPDFPPDTWSDQTGP